MVSAILNFFILFLHSYISTLIFSMLLLNCGQIFLSYSRYNTFIQKNKSFIEGSPTGVQPSLPKVWKFVYDMFWERPESTRLPGIWRHLLRRYQMGFGKGLSVQGYLISMVENHGKSIDPKREKYAVLLTNRSKRLDYLPCDLIDHKTSHLWFWQSLFKDYSITNKMRRVNKNYTK